MVERTMRSTARNQRGALCVDSDRIHLTRPNNVGTVSVNAGMVSIKNITAISTSKNGMIARATFSIFSPAIAAAVK